jgi:hypothetical protein
MIGDSGYDDHSLYDELSTKRGFELLVYPVQRYEHTHTDRQTGADTLL